MSALLKKAFSISRDTKFTLLCARVVFSTTITTKLLHTGIPHRRGQAVNEQDALSSHPRYAPVEVLRERAYRIEKEASLRSRCNWTPEEDEKLLELIKIHGTRWTMLSRQFVDRPPSVLLNRYALLQNKAARGPWTKEELKTLKDLGRGRPYQDIQDWEMIQQKMPEERPLFMIKQTYKHSLDPGIKHGKWSSDEVEKLRSLIFRLGEDNMEQVALMMGSRTPRQCLERWRWQMTTEKKGRFTSAEDAKIVAAVEQYGENFAVVAKVTGISRTPRHISQHYHNTLSPHIDRSEWTLEEEEQTYNACMKHGRDMCKAKEELGSKSFL
ncbi:hypothetical protein [Parasitella parasitica]|uniref:HTH myb-type domain-containing protein n=1 Tax=Parasitella parasitica TaxID=35722 RepID=A0A0B7NIV1_9FUNG|nr:hypothetical protein [Parasitella parasitica]